MTGHIKYNTKKDLHLVAIMGPILANTMDLFSGMRCYLVVNNNITFREDRNAYTND